MFCVNQSGESLASDMHWNRKHELMLLCLRCTFYTGEKVKSSVSAFPGCFKGSGTLSITKFPCPHPYTTLSGKVLELFRIGQVSTKLKCPSFNA